MEMCNPGVFWGFLSGSGLIIPVNLIFLGIIGWLWRQEKNSKDRLGWLLIFFGGLSNLLERMIFGCVHDYLKIFDFWPTFNLADVAIVVGAFIILIMKGQGERGKRKL
jgi:signal peptidase II